MIYHYVLYLEESTVAFHWVPNECSTNFGNVLANYFYISFRSYNKFREIPRVTARSIIKFNNVKLCNKIIIRNIFIVIYLYTNMAGSSLVDNMLSVIIL